MQEDQRSVKSLRSNKSAARIAPYGNIFYSTRMQNKLKRLSYITEADLFRLAAINMPRHTIVQAMPVSLQVESTEINRMRSHYIKMIHSVWKAYSKSLFGAACPVFRSFTQDGDIIPSAELCEIAGIEQEQTPDKDLYPSLNIVALAKQVNSSETIVMSILKLIFATCKSVIYKRWF